MGCYQLQNNETFRHAFKYGYKHFDGAAFYKNEKQIGEEAKKAMEEIGISRNELFIATKIPPTH